MNSSRDPNEQQVGALQEEMWTTLEKVKALGDIIASVEIQVDEADQSRGLYIIKLKRYIFMLETDMNKLSERQIYHLDLKKETEGYDIRK